MPDTKRTLAALQALLADNVTEDISPQDVRDFLVSVFVTAAEGDMIYQNDSGLLAVVGGTKGAGKAPMGQADGTVAWEAGGGARELITSNTLGADAGSVTFSSIPDTYDDLILVLAGVRCTAVRNFSFPKLRVGVGTVDSGSNYNTAFESSGSPSGNGNTTASDAFFMGNTGNRWIPSASATSGRFGYGEIRILRYTNSGHRYIHWWGHGAEATATISNGGGTWVTAETDPIDILTFFPETDDFLAGSVFELYGVNYS